MHNLEIGTQSWDSENLCNLEIAQILRLCGTCTYMIQTFKRLSTLCTWFSHADKLREGNCKTIWNEDCQCFSFALLAILTSKTQPAPAGITFSIRSALTGVGSVSQLMRLPYLYASVSHQLSSCLTHRLFVLQACMYSFHVIQAACCKPLSPLSFQAV